MIYAQSVLLYEIIPNAPHSSFDPKVKPRPHVDGIVGCASAKPMDSVVKQVSQLSINQSASGQATDSSQLSDQKGNQQPEKNKKKGKNNRKGGNRNENDNTNDKNT